MTETSTPLHWRKSSYSGTHDGQNCVEAAHLPGDIALRDSKQPNETLTIDHDEWSAFLAAVSK